MKTTSFRLALAAVLTAAFAHAATISLDGTFQTDDETMAYHVTLTQLSKLELRSLAYAGGTNGNGGSVAAGGFDTYLSLFHGTGQKLLLALNEDRPGVCGTDNPADPSTGFCFDAGLSLTLQAGKYIIVLSQSGNSPLGPGFADGFQMTGIGNYTGGPFLDIAGNQRNGNWALDITIDPLTVPEPSTILLVSAGLAGALLRARGHRRS